MMELDYRTLHVHVEMCVCVCLGINVCLCVYLHTFFMYVHAFFLRVYCNFSICFVVLIVYMRNSSFYYSELTP